MANIGNTINRIFKAGGSRPFDGSVQDDGRPKFLRYHRFTLTSGHDISIYWDVINGYYRAHYFSRISGGHNIGHQKLREVFGQLRTRVSEDVNPDLNVVKERINNTSGHDGPRSSPVLVVGGQNFAMGKNGNMYAWGPPLTNQNPTKKQGV